MAPLMASLLGDIGAEPKLTLTALSFSGYLNENGNLNLKNFEKYLEKLSEVRCCFVNLTENSPKSFSQALFMLCGILSGRRAAASHASGLVGDGSVHSVHGMISDRRNAPLPEIRL